MQTATGSSAAAHAAGAAVAAEAAIWMNLIPTTRPAEAVADGVNVPPTRLLRPSKGQEATHIS